MLPPTAFIQEFSCSKFEIKSCSTGLKQKADKEFGPMWKVKTINLFSLLNNLKTNTVIERGQSGFHHATSFCFNKRMFMRKEE